MDYREALRLSRVLDLLDRFAPKVVGTLPLGLSVASSDIDIVCEAREPDVFADVVWQAYRDFERFQLFRWREHGRPVVARFECHSWPFELFADQRRSPGNGLGDISMSSGDCLSWTTDGSAQPSYGSAQMV